MRPKLTYIIPVYNRSSLLLETLSSIAKQTLDDLEIVVMDDGSEEKLDKLIAEQFPAVKFVRIEKNSGPAKARNIGLKYAHGNFVCFLDADDVLDDDFSQLMTREASLNHSAILCLSRPLVSSRLTWPVALSYKIINLLRNQVLRWLYFFNNKKLITEAFFSVTLSRIIFPLETLSKIRFNETMRNCEDWEFIIRYLKKYNISILPKQLIDFRFTDDSLTHIWRKKTNWKYYDKVVSLLPQNSRNHPLIKGFKLYKQIFSKS